MKSPNSVLDLPSADQEAILVLIEGLLYKTPSCWLWKGPQNKAGYGYFRWKRRYYLVHRAMLEIRLHRKITEDCESMHACDIKICARPSFRHVLAAPHAANMLDYSHRLAGTKVDLKRALVQRARKRAGLKALHKQRSKKAPGTIRYYQEIADLMRSIGRTERAEYYQALADGKY